MKKRKEFTEISKDVYTLIKEWGDDYNYTIESLKCDFAAYNAYIKTDDVVIYFDHLIELNTRLNEIGVKVDVVEGPGVNDAGLLIWLYIL